MFKTKVLNTQIALLPIIFLNFTIVCALEVRYDYVIWTREILYSGMLPPSYQLYI